jgi:hypothetical protein
VLLGFWRCWLTSRSYGRDEGYCVLDMYCSSGARDQEVGGCGGGAGYSLSVCCCCCFAFCFPISFAPCPMAILTVLLVLCGESGRSKCTCLLTAGSGRFLRDVRSCCGVCAGLVYV